MELIHQNTAKWIILIGVVICLIGIGYYFFGNKLGFIGKLPGDIRIERENFKFYFPITTMILFTILINILIKIFQRLL